MQATVLILGARGRFGLAAARAFGAAGWRVLGHTRPGASQPAEAGIEWLGIDLRDTQALAAAAQGATVVVHALNPAYTNQAWREQVAPMTDAAIRLAHTLAATLMVPGNVYNFGAAMPAVLSEGTPQMAQTVKGRVRIAMEAQLQASGVRVVVIRAGNFFGAGRGTWFDAVNVKDLKKGWFTHAGSRELATAWAYLPDLARCFLAVAQQREQLRPFEVLHFAGHTLSAQQWLDALDPLARAQGWVKPGAHLKLRALPWPVIRIGAWFMPAWAALLELRYLWDTPHRLTNDKLTALIGPEPHTPLPLAARQALADLGLLASAPRRGRAPAMAG
ncbi:NAD-dependent epimerase/dehydratase family protein [Rhodoferax sp.]|uniref:NAD-dependent epimerase/dehydratase family protein n=1 Tax=Rhodoferax sp. TaxID=50421 RepID=UPI00274E66E1|nr:sugar nucleotide-binding protein [Rhodoferax sp.]